MAARLESFEGINQIKDLTSTSLKVILETLAKEALIDVNFTDEDVSVISTMLRKKSERKTIPNTNQCPVEIVEFINIRGSRNFRRILLLPSMQFGIAFYQKQVADNNFPVKHSLTVETVKKMMAEIKAEG